MQLMDTCSMIDGSLGMDERADTWMDTWLFLALEQSTHFWMIGCDMANYPYTSPEKPHWKIEMDQAVK